MPDSTLSTLENIRIKIRRITRNPSSTQITDLEINKYINTFILYDMPAYLKLDSLKEVLTFFTSPNVDTYETNTVDATNPLYNFKNKYTNVMKPVYIAGIASSFYQSVDEFYSIYPQTNYKVNIGTGNGVLTNFTGILSNIPILKNQVTVSAIDLVGNPLIASDNGLGGFTGNLTAGSTISYITGAYNITFTTAPALNEIVWLQSIPYSVGKPISILYFNNKFILRPVPDASYRVEVQAYRRPTELANAGDMPELSEWWEYIALGAGIKILQDRLDTEGVNMLLPQFENQEILITRRKSIQNSGRRTATIYSEGQ